MCVWVCVVGNEINTLLIAFMLQGLSYILTVVVNGRRPTLATLVQIEKPTNRTKS